MSVSHIWQVVSQHLWLSFDAKLDGWSGWPFTGYGYEGGIWPSIARAAFLLLILVAISLFLRKLFGPGGKFRGEGWETIQEAKEREARENALGKKDEKTAGAAQDGGDGEAGKK